MAPKERRSGTDKNFCKPWPCPTSAMICAVADVESLTASVAVSIPTIVGAKLMEIEHCVPALKPPLLVKLAHPL